MHDLLSSLLIRESIDQLGFVDADQAMALIPSAFSDGDQAAMRAAFIIAQWIILSKYFGIPKAEPSAVAKNRTSEILSNQSIGSFGLKLLSQWSRTVRLMY